MKAFKEGKQGYTCDGCFRFVRQDWDPLGGLPKGWQRWFPAWSTARHKLSLHVCSMECGRKVDKKPVPRVSIAEVKEREAKQALGALKGKPRIKVTPEGGG